MAFENERVRASVKTRVWSLRGKDGYQIVWLCFVPVGEMATWRDRVMYGKVQIRNLCIMFIKLQFFHGNLLSKKQYFH